MAIDVFEVFDHRSDGAHTPPPEPRFQAARTIFAVSVAIAVLGAMSWGMVTAFRQITQGNADVAICSTTQVKDQTAEAAWLADRLSQATGTTEVQVERIGCNKASKGQKIGVMAYLVDDKDLAGAVGVLAESDCPIALAADKSGTCATRIDDLGVTVKIAKATSADAKGDYVWTVTAGAPPA